MGEKDCMKKTTMMLSAIIVVAAVAGFILINNEGVLDPILNGLNTGENGNPNTNGDTEEPSNNEYTSTDPNHDGRLVGNWTYVEGTSSGQPITHIVSGWINYKADGNWTEFFDYGDQLLNEQGTWQAKDGVLCWGTNGSEISDWYSVDDYQIVGDDLIISSDYSEMRYRIH
jgi:hypothetical protein